MIGPETPDSVVRAGGRRRRVSDGVEEGADVLGGGAGVGAQRAWPSLSVSGSPSSVTPEKLPSLPLHFVDWSGPTAWSSLQSPEDCTVFLLC